MCRDGQYRINSCVVSARYLLAQCAHSQRGGASRSAPLTLGNLIPPPTTYAVPVVPEGFHR